MKFLKAKVMFTQRFSLVPSLSLAVGLAAILATNPGRAASFVSDANGFVFIEAENFDLNVTQDNGAWRFENTPLDLDAFSGWGYVTADSSGGTDPNINPHLDYSVNFSQPGPYFIWVAGSDAGGKAVHLGLDGVAPASAQNIGGPDGIFGARFGGQVRWSGTNNTGSGFISKAFLTVPSAGTHTVNLFIREAGLKVDWILLTTNISYVPGPYPNPANLPAQTVAPSAALAVALTQPATGKIFASNSVVTLSAKAATNNSPVNKVEFFARLLPAGANSKLGEATELPYTIGWTNPVPGQYALTARVTDGGALTATSAVTSVTIAIPATYVTPLRWKTNTFEGGLGSFTTTTLNQSGGFDFGWKNLSLPGGGTGALGGLVVRSYSVVPYVGEPLERKVSLNDDLWFSGTLVFTNVNANNDTFIGYFDALSSSHPRVGLKVREPTSAGGLWRFSVEPNGTKLNSTVASGVPANFELHWIPSGVGNGSGTLTGSVAGLEFSVDYSGTVSTATFDTFGWLAPSQGNDDPTRTSYQFYDNLAYVVPASQRLKIEPLANQQVRLSWDIPGFALQFNTNGPTGPNWTDSAAPVVGQGGSYVTTNSVTGASRWFRLKQTP